MEVEVGGGRGVYGEIFVFEVGRNVAGGGVFCVGAVEGVHLYLEESGSGESCGFLLDLGSYFEIGYFRGPISLGGALYHRTPL